jgi:hypothetical protein
LAGAAYRPGLSITPRDGSGRGRPPSRMAESGLRRQPKALHNA